MVTAIMDQALTLWDDFGVPREQIELICDALQAIERGETDAPYDIRERAATLLHTIPVLKDELARRLKEDTANMSEEDVDFWNNVDDEDYEVLCGTIVDDEDDALEDHAIDLWDYVQ